MVNYIPEVKLYPLEKTGKKFRKMADFADERGAVLIVDEGNPQYLLIRLAQPDCETEDIPEDEILEEVEDDGNIVGRQITAGEKEEEVPVFKCLKTKDGDKEGYILQIGEASEGILLEGSGTIDGNMLNGNYDISVGGEKTLTFDVTGHDLSLWKEGKIKGSYGISGITDGKFDGLGLTFTVDGAEDKTYVRASLTSELFL